MSVESSARPSASPLGRNRSLLSRFRVQFGQRSRNVPDFYIEPDNPWRSYSPGDVYKGTVVLTVVRPIRITHLVVCLHGYVKVFKNAIPSGEAAPDMGFVGTGRGRRGSEYLGNGLATLFEDEIVLCGEGRLKEGIYKFRFEMLFPPYALPSSINFERGAITYMVTSTLTKPTTMNPILSCRRRVNLLENIDIAPFPAPKARIVTLEPVTKRAKSKGKGKLPGPELTADTLSLSPSVNGMAASDHRPPLSPAPSDDVSSSDRLSNSSQSFQIASDVNGATPTASRNGEARSIAPSISDKVITAKIEVLRSGVLAGDTLPVKITINHCKQVLSPHGIIVTLYRQGRIDVHPSIPVGSAQDGKKPIFEDVYPRSRTGLGGLTLGTSRTHSVFRKDLSQTFAPLIVNPANMTADIKTSIRIPEDTFPTITRVPGAMLSFRYYVEVVADLRGKLNSSDRYLPRFHMVSGGSTFSPSGQVLNSLDPGGSSITANWGGNILDTDQIRREKGVIAVAFEVVVGTSDSRRGNNNSSKKESVPSVAGGSITTTSQPTTHSEPPTSQNLYEDLAADPSPMPSASTDDEYPGQEEYDFTPDPYWGEYPTEYSEQHYPEPGSMIPTPELEEPEDEKSRLRRAEEMLLPSRPPDDTAPGPSLPTAAMSMTTQAAVNPLPTAPVLLEDDHLHDYHHLCFPPPSSDLRSTALLGPVPNVGPPQTVAAEPRHTHNLPADDRHGPRVSDDKEELERQRLMMEASAPDTEPAIDAPTLETPETPSAPVFYEDEDDIAGAVAPADETLPRYQR
ncbi:hypothetical protein ASPZODRAFT_141657 [Penicilliopsis zonata CBS 506.65]|uniref:Arrestin C-terminal-like domain-containing protein n=1 Tax=Penicilliopsis zonata CBS 506.65 TaxID=1073090 RepID=A0A1L9SI37_9EURO|nr:hypothetical protein ASPZODRAFT_141657 [Penicilliopsis zonata CBS 506.65]OJJ46875.1 hypothetical protein ASPZODRAFT_141657 [Penicilliopsis zonata CBS 506.65]